MNGIGLFSHIGLWFLVLLELVLILSLARAVGKLLQRVGTSAALTTAQGLAINSPAPEVELSDIDGRQVHIGKKNPKERLLLFLSTSCPVCTNLLPNLRGIFRNESKHMDIIVSVNGEDMDKHALYHGICQQESLFYIKSEEVFTRFQVASVPYAIIVDREGLVRAKGLVNTAEQVESLLDFTTKSVEENTKEREGMKYAG